MKASSIKWYNYSEEKPLYGTVISLKIKGDEANTYIICYEKHLFPKEFNHSILNKASWKYFYFRKNLTLTEIKEKQKQTKDILNKINNNQGKDL